MQWNWIDLAIVLVIFLSMITGLLRGFVKEIIALCTWALAIWLGFNYSEALDPFLSKYLTDQSMRTVVSFLILLFSALIVGAIVNAAFSFVLKRAGLSGTDRTLGMGFGFIRGVFIVALVLMGIRMTSLPYEKYGEESKLYASFDPVVNLMYGYMPDFIKQIKALDHQDIVVKSEKPELIKQQFTEQEFILD